MLGTASTWWPRARSLRKQGFCPHATTITRNVVRMDMVAMDLRRRWWLGAPPCNLSLAYDASPQHGVEIFNTYIKRAETLEPMLRARESFEPFDANSPFHDEIWSGAKVGQSILPCQVLGCGRMTVTDKVAALLNQFYLEFGPGAESIRRALASVVCALSDMGAELAIVETRDCLDVFLATGDVSAPGPRASDRQGFLFPNALQVPGPIHIVDLVLRTALSATEWWVEWEGRAKEMLQWFHLEHHRNAVAHFLDSDVELPQETRTAWKDALSRRPEKFADWRWQTLRRATRSLAALRAPALHFACAMSTHSRVLPKIIKATVLDGHFWARLDMVLEIMGPLFGFDSWCQGCPCHDLQQQAGNVVCDRKGCRGPELAHKVATMADESQRALQQFVESQTTIAHAVGSADESNGVLWPGLAGDAVALYSNATGLLRAKFAFLLDPPWSIWHVDSVASAAKFLRSCDDLRARGHILHRVAEAFAGEGHKGVFRADMECWASGGQPTARLLDALFAYRSAKTDDTVQETPHKDVSYVASRARGSKLAYVFAQVRFPHNLVTWDQTDPDEREAAWASWTAMGNKGDAWLQRRRFAGGYFASRFVQDVYRLRPVGLRDWGSLTEFLQQSLPRNTTARRGADVALRREWLSRTLQPGWIYSLSFPGANHEGNESPLTDTQLPDMLFEVSGIDVEKKKFLTSSPTVDEWRSMLAPTTVQTIKAAHGQWSWQDNPMSAEQTRVRVCRVGTPEVQDLLMMARWESWYEQLRRWREAPDGSLELQGICSHLWRSQLSWKFDPPAILFLQGLKEAGWSAGIVPGGSMTFARSAGRQRRRPPTRCSKCPRTPSRARLISRA